MTFDSKNTGMALELVKYLLRAKVELTFLKSCDNSCSERTPPLSIIANEINHLTDKIDKYIICSITDLSGNIVFANNIFCRAVDYTERQILGKSHRMIKSHYHCSGFFYNLWLSIRNGHDWRGCIKNRNKFGEEFWWDTLITPLPGPSGNAEYYLSICEELTESKGTKATCLTIEVGRNLVILQIAHIILVEAKGNYTQIYTRNGDKFLVKKTIKQWQTTLDRKQFFRIHRSHIINLGYVEHIHKEKGTRLLIKFASLNHPVYCSRRNGTALKNAMIERMNGA